MRYVILGVVIVVMGILLGQTPQGPIVVVPMVGTGTLLNCVKPIVCTYDPKVNQYKVEFVPVPAPPEPQQ